MALSALKKVLLYGVYYNGTLSENTDPNPSKNFAIQATMHAIQSDPNITNDKLGQGIRASVEAVRMIDLAFKELCKLKKGEDKEEPKEKTNEAR